MSVNGRRAVDMLRAAGEPTRLRILALLAREELAVMELGQVLDQSQPRVSRHLKLLTEAGLVQRFPDGAWVFYRLSAEEPAHAFVAQTLALLAPDDPAFQRDVERLEAVREGRAGDAEAYFASNAARWDEIRSLYVSEAAVEEAILAAAGPGPFRRLIDLGAGTGRMLTLLGPRAESALGLDLSHQMLNVARLHAAEAGLKNVELRHGDIFATGLPSACADLVVVHRVLHYLGDPARAVMEAARLVRPGGRLLIVDFAPHELEFLRTHHAHRRLGLSEAQVAAWAKAAGLEVVGVKCFPPTDAEGLTVCLWRLRDHKERAS
jgi:ubiquinone/menaquinone biosynthesis C-methylase UbiE